MRYETVFSVIVFDLDDFKKINDTFGHLIGDQVLQEVVNVIKITNRECDALARFGGEEFVVLLPEIGLEQARQTAERFRRIIEEISVETSTGTVQVTASLGIATFEKERDTTIDKLIDRADQALYAAKKGGRNCVKIWLAEDSA